jgi:hypothetical protein
MELESGGEGRNLMDERKKKEGNEARSGGILLQVLFLQFSSRG